MKLRDWRKKHKLSMVKAGELFDLTQPSISRIERGEQWPNKSTIQRITERTKGAVTANDFVLDGTA